jgi:pantoate--beta-alanine ligase
LKIYKKSKDLNQYLIKEKNKNHSIGFVPTMGALHLGHISLINKSKSENDVSVVSIFINPTQFNNSIDLEKYPRTLEKDLELLIEANCDILYLPEIEDVYPNGISNLENFDLKGLDKKLEGVSRPGHFQGVANVVKKLLASVIPDRLYLGEKDFQQVMVISRLVEIMKSEKIIPTNLEIISCNILREKNGLAMSSRNVRLTKKQRSEASNIYKALEFVRDSKDKTSLNKLIEYARSIVAEIPEARIDYFNIYNSKTLEPATSIESNQKLICLIAVYVGEVRLIDNIVL